MSTRPIEPSSADSDETQADSPATLHIDGLVKRYGRHTAVDGLSLRLAPGEFVGFIGPNGAGKSTTMKTIVGLLNPDAGRVLVDGIDIARDPVGGRARVGYVAQDLELYRYLTGEELLRFVAAVRGVPQEAVEERVAELMALTELNEARGRLVREYSGGMARKIAIAAALIARPRLLLLDESFVGLDPESTYRLRRYLKHYVEAGNTVLLSSHILDMLERITTRVVFLHKGRLVSDLSRAELLRELEKPEHTDLTQLYLTLTEQSHLIER